MTLCLVPMLYCPFPWVTDCWFIYNSAAMFCSNVKSLWKNRVGVYMTGLALPCCTFCLIRPGNLQRPALYVAGCWQGTAQHYSLNYFSNAAITYISNIAFLVEKKEVTLVIGHPNTIRKRKKIQQFLNSVNTKQ